MCVKIKKICIVLLIVLSCFLTTDAFGKSDIIRLQMPNGVTVEYKMLYHRDKIYSSYYSKLVREQKTFKKNLDNFLKRWKVLGITNLEGKKPLYIKDVGLEIRITERNDKTTVFFPKDTKLALMVKGKHKLDLFLTYADVFVYFDKIQQLEELSQYDIEKILKEGDEKLATVSADKKNKRRPLEAWLSVDKDNSVGLVYQKLIQRFSTNFISLSFSPNIENINGSWLSGIEPNIGVVFNDKWRLDFGYEFKYNFSDKHTTNISHWGNFRAMVKSKFFSNDWVGISAGFLFKQRGDFFDNHKFRFGFPVSYDNFTVTPEFYTKGFFKKTEKDNAYFGVKISFSL